MLHHDTPATSNVIPLFPGVAPAPAPAVPGADPLDAFQSYWESRRAGAAIPRRMDIDPRGIAPLLEQAFVIEKIAPGLARFRVAGAHLSDLMGMEVRGMPLSAFITPKDRDAFGLMLAELFERPARLELSVTSARRFGQARIDGRLLLLPLRSDLGDVSRALGAFVTEGAIGRAPRRFDITAHQITPIPPREDAEAQGLRLVHDSPV